MSEAVQTPEVQAQAPRPSAKSSGGTLAALAFLIGLGGAAAAGFSLWQQQQLNGLLSQQQNNLSRTATELGDANQALHNQLARLPSAEELDERRRLLASVQGDQQQLAERLDRVLGQSRESWRLAEAEHLLRLANLRLQALQDMASAEALVQGADDILRQQDDPGSFAARAELAKVLEELRTSVRPDRTGLFLQLGALREQANELKPLNPNYADQGGVLLNLAAEGDGQSTWGIWLEKLSHYFRIQFDAEPNVKPLLAGQNLAQVRLTLSLAIEQAQWAALHGQAQVFTQALEEAQQVLKDYFNSENPDSQALLKRLAELAKQPVTVAVPNLTAAQSALEGYLHQRSQPAAEVSAP